MKKLFGLLLIAGMFSMLACGPSKEEKEAIEKHKADSIKMALEQRMQDSLNQLALKQADSLKAAKIADSIAKAAEAAKTAVKKVAPKVVKPKVIDKTQVKPGQGKG